MTIDEDDAATSAGKGPVFSISPRLYNEDIKPVKPQTWGIYNLFAMWMSNVHSLAGYVFAAGLFALGLSAWQVFTALLVGIMLIYFFTNMTGRMGQKYGIAFAAACRPGFGVFGANIPSMIKAITATAWYGIQTWVASTALVVVALRFFPSLEPLTYNSILGLSTLGWICFGIMWFAQLIVFFYGWEAIRKFCDWAGPAIYVVMFGLIVWIVWRAGGFNQIDFTLGSRELSGSAAVGMWATAVALTVAWFAGTTLNFADFGRFLRTPREMRIGNFLGLPINFMLFALATVITTAGGMVVFNELIMDPVELVARIDHVTAALLGAVTFSVATVATNIVANFVSGAMDLANLVPKHLSFRRAGLIVSVVSAMVLPWKLYANPVMIDYTLGTFSAFIGPVFGIIVCEYYFIQRQQLDLDHLYTEDPRGKYWYTRGFNKRGIAALAIAGSLATIIAQLPILRPYAPFSFFFGAAFAILFHWLLSKERRMELQHERVGV